jgi:hypothetical protein
LYLINLNEILLVELMDYLHFMFVFEYLFLFYNFYLYLMIFLKVIIPDVIEYFYEMLLHFDELFVMIIVEFINRIYLLNIFLRI